METYKVYFNGRRQGAIGIFYHTHDTVDAENPKHAVRALHKQYDFGINSQGIKVLEFCKAQDCFVDVCTVDIGEIYN